MVSTSHLEKKWQFTQEEQKRFTAFIEILIQIDQKNNSKASINNEQHDRSLHKKS